MCRYSRSTCTVRALEISLVQLSPGKACATVLCFLMRDPTALHRQGASSEMDLPCNHRSVHNNALRPFPNSTYIDAMNIASTIDSDSSGSKCQERASSARRYHSHLMRKGYPNRCRSTIPRPPSSVGRQTLGHANRQCPPFAD